MFSEEATEPEHQSGRPQRARWRALALIVAGLATLAFGLLFLLPCRFNPLRPCEAFKYVDICNNDDPSPDASERDAALPPCSRPTSKKDKKRPADDVEIYYVTTRALEATAPFFGAGIANDLALGKANVRVPFMLPGDARGNEDVKCTKVIVDPDANEIKLRNKCSKEGYRALCGSGTCRVVSDRGYIDVKADLREEQEYGHFTRLAHIQPASGRNLGRRYERFVNDIGHSMERNAKAGGTQNVFIYIHGFNTTFEQSLQSGSHLAADLAMWANPQSGADRHMAMGVPIAFSWPTLPFKLDYTPPYLESQMRADASALEFERLVDELIAQSGVEEINILAHSMGNRIALENLRALATSRVNRFGKSVVIRVVMAAPDVGRREFHAVLDGLKGSTGLQVIVYSSDKDVALQKSSEIQKKKKKASEDSCRLGRLNGERNCLKTFSSDLPLTHIDASAFYTDEQKAENLWIQFGHGYFEDAPMVLSDISCALRGFGPGEKRSTKRRPDDDMFAPSRYYTLESPNDSDVGVDAVEQFCASTGRILLYEADEGRAEPAEIRRTVYFDVEDYKSPCAGPVDNDARGAPPRQIPCYDVGDATIIFVDVAGDIQRILGANSGSSVTVTIEGYADQSDLTADGKYDNCGLSLRRAEAARVALEMAFRDAEVAATFEAKGKCAAGSLPVRDQNSRKAEITIRFR